MQRVAQDWLVLTQLTHHDASALGIVMGLQFAPQLLLLPWTGLAADRLNQRKLLMLTQATMGVLALILGVLTIAGVIELWHVYVLAFLSGSAGCAGCAGATDLRGRDGGRCGPHECRGIELNLI
jgi:MFS family permease